MGIPLGVALSTADLAVAGAAVLSAAYIAVGIRQRGRACPRRGESWRRDGE